MLIVHAALYALLTSCATGQFVEPMENLNCSYNLAGENCDVCRAGYVMDVTSGHCHMCSCPMPTISNNFALTCNVHPGSGETFSCLCRDGYAGRFCEKCAYGYYGNPLELDGSCEELDCSGNVNTSDVSAFDMETGACLKCLPDYDGRYCEHCRDGLYGDAVTEKNCTECRCDSIGSTSCDHLSGTCQCKNNVIGDYCSGCKPGYVGFALPDGCITCDCACHGGCDVMTGKCECSWICFRQEVVLCAVIWAVIAAVLVLIVIAAVVTVVRKLRKKKKKGEYDVNTPGQDDIGMQNLWNSGSGMNRDATDVSDKDDDDESTGLMTSSELTTESSDHQAQCHGDDVTADVPLSTFQGVKLRPVRRDSVEKRRPLLGDESTPQTVRERVDVMDATTRELHPECEPADIVGENPDVLIPLRVTIQTD